MLHRLRQIYLKEQFNPSYIGLFINPFYFARKGLYRHVSDLITNLTGELLDIGCGTKPYEKICVVDKYIGLEIDNAKNRKNKKVDFYYDGNAMPFADKSFDSLMSNQVFEHVFNPNDFLKEVNRVAKVNAKLLLTVPFVWDEHEQPYDFARYSSFGLQHILSINGFEIIEQRKINNGLEVIFQLINDYIYKVTHSKNSYINLATMITLLAPVNLLGIFLSKILPRNNDLYLDNIVLAKKVTDV